MTYEDPVHESSRAIMSEYYDVLARAAEEGRPAAYLMISGNCVEILQAMDVLPVFPEVNALQMAIRKKSLPLILKAEQAGYSSDNCAYVKADMGMNLAGGGRIPPPALIVCNYVGCNVYLKWFEHLSAHFKAPIFTIDVPFLREKEPLPSDVAYVTAQLRELISKLEELTGRRLDEGRLSEAMANSRTCEEGWSRAKELCKGRPAPFDAFFDSINMMGPINVLRGTPQAARFFEAAVRAYEERRASGTGPLPQEKFRTVIEGPPPYPAYKNFRDLFSRWGAVAVQSTYSTVGGIWEFGFRHDPERPLESIAEQMIVHNLCNRSLLERYGQIERYLDEWDADALVIHSVKSCRLFSAGQGDMREYFSRGRSVPVLMVESDLEDPRYYAEAQIKNRIDAFFESLEHRRIKQGART
jgi:benzoyl-CoA reductase subunit B